MMTLILLTAPVVMMWAQEMNEKFSMTTQMFLHELQEKKAQPALAPRRIPARQLPGTKQMLMPHRQIAQPDTVGGTAYIPCFIYLKDVRDLSTVCALGVKVEETFDGIDFITARVPVNQIEALADIDNVTKIKVAQQMRPSTDKARELTHVDDLLTQSQEAAAMGITSMYDGTGVVLGIIDTGIDFQHIAFKDKDGNSRIKRAYVYTSTGTEYSTITSTAPTTDDETADHGTHTATTAGGSSVITDGSTVTVTDNHANATYGGMAPGADLYLAGIKGLDDTGIVNALKKMVEYADNQGKPLVVSNSWGSSWGPRDGTGEMATLVGQYFGDDHPNRVILFASSNDAGHRNGNEGGGYFVKKDQVSSSSPLGTIIRTSGYGGDYYTGLIACAWNASNAKKLNCKIHVLNSSGGIEKTWTVTTNNTSSFSGLSDYYAGSMTVYINYINGKYRLALNSDEGLESKNQGAYTLAIEVYPSSDSADINMWAGDWSLFAANYTTEDHTWMEGTDDMCVSDEATIPNAISIGAYASKNSWTASDGNSYAAYYTEGDIAFFSSYATAEQSPTGQAYPWISAPGARLAAGVNHYHTASVDDYSYYSTDNMHDLVVNNSNHPYAMMEGTSMATPVAAGIVALWLQASMDEKAAHKNLTVNDVKEIMQATAIQDSYTTTGTNASHFGKGKIDALAGIQYILGISSETTNETIDFTKQGFSNQEAVTSVNGTDCTISFSKGTGSNAPKYYDSGTAIRLYGGNTMTVASENKTMVGIKLTFGSSDGSNDITTNVETYDAGTWTGSASSVTFTIGGTSGNRRISQVEVTYSEGGTTPVNPSLAYYKNADGKQGAELKTAMSGIILDHTAKTYDYLWTAFQTTDVRSDGTIWDMYSNVTNYDPVNGSHSNSAEGSGFNREHSFPKSWFGGEVMPMFTDLHHLYPVDGNINTRRSNNPYGETNGENYKSANDFSKLGSCTYPGYTGTVFEPADEYKGDFARTYFYMVTCYEEQLPDWYTNYSNTEVVYVLDGTTYPGLQEWMLNMLMEWAKNDPVSEKEINRNNAVYGIQANRNPFIDYPGLQEYVWGTLTTTAFSYDNYQEPIYAEKQDVTMSFSPTEATATMGEDFTEPTLTVSPEGLTVTYSSSNTDVATVDENSGEVTLVAAGETTVTATFAGNYSYNAATASYTLTVNAAVTPVPTGDSDLFELVADASTLAAGDKILIAYVNGDSAKAMSATQSTNNRPAVSVTKNSDGTLTPADDAQVITLEKDGNNFLFNVGESYLYAASSSANQLKTKAKADDNAKATIGISNGYATITFQGTNTRNTMRYNPNGNNPIFSCYASSSTAGSLPQIYRMIPTISLDDIADNTTTIVANNAKKVTVTLTGRTLWKDGDWNTLCLPFDVVLKGSVLDGATVMKLNAETSNLTDGTLTLNFADETTTLTAGTPYIVKWSSGDNLVNPVFSCVTINNASTEVSFSGGKFLGNYSPVAFVANDKSKLFLGSANTLYYPNADMTVNACRAYFELSDGQEVRGFVLNFGDDVTSIRDAQATKHKEADAWYTIDGRKLNSKPSAKGIYIHRGRKVVIK